MNNASRPPVSPEILRELERRLGKVHTRQRLGVERDHEAKVFGYGLNFFHPENWYSGHALIKIGLKVTGLYWRGRKNAAAVRLKHNMIASAGVPEAFDGYKILHLSDLHVDSNEVAMERVSNVVAHLRYDLCVLTGDYRGGTAGPFEATMHGLRRLRSSLHGDIYAVLGNHDTIAMVPEIEAMGIRMLINESATVNRGEERIHIAGIDDAHYFRVDNIEKAADDIAPDEFSILLSHTPEVYRQAAHAGFDVMLSGHTHGGQICLPGQVPITLDANLPRRLGSGAWWYGTMQGYTSVGAGTSIVPVRLNCPPEVTLHELRRAQ